MKAVAFSNNDMAVAAWTFGAASRVAWGLQSIESTSRRARKLACQRSRHSQTRIRLEPHNRRGSGSEVLLEGRIR